MYLIASGQVRKGREQLGRRFNYELEQYGLAKERQLLNQGFHAMAFFFVICCPKFDAKFFFALLRMLCMTICNEDCVILRNEIKHNNAQKQPFYWVALRYLPFTICNEDCAVFAPKKSAILRKDKILINKNK